LTYELLLGRLFVSADEPRERDRDRLGLSGGVLDPDVRVDGISVGLKAQRLLHDRSGNVSGEHEVADRGVRP